MEGFVLNVNQTGTPISVSQVKLPELTEPQPLSTNHQILLFEDRKRGEDAISIMERALNECGVCNFIIISMRYEGSDPRCIYNTALYIAIGQINAEVVKRIKIKISNEYEIEHDSEISKDLIEDEFAAIFIDQVADIYDSHEIGYPEKFRAIYDRGWVPERIHRYGQWASETAATDDELYRVIGGEEGTNTAFYRRMSSPRLRLHWADFKKQSELCLRGNEVWFKGFVYFCEIAEQNRQDSSATVSTYNLKNWPISLFKLVARGESDYLPAFEAVVVDSSEQRGWAFIGIVVWDGATKIKSVGDLFQDLCDDIFEFLFIAQLGGAWELDAEIMRRLGLSYRILLFELEPDTKSNVKTLAYENGKLIEVPESENSRGLDVFVAENGKFLGQLAAEISSISTGL